MNFYSAIDEYTDVANKIEASKITNDVMDALRNKEATSQFSHGKLTTMTQEWVLNFEKKKYGETVSN